MHVDLTDEVDWVLSQADLTEAVDGFVFGVRPDIPPCDGYAAVERLPFGHNLQTPAACAVR